MHGGRSSGWAEAGVWLAKIGKIGGWVLLLTFLLSCQSLLITYSKSTGQYSYKPSTAIFLAEVAKFVLSAAILQYRGVPLNFRLTAQTLPYCVPALIYFLQNNLVFWALLYVDPTTYQVLVNLKIITTGVLHRYVMQRELSSMQWAALVLLFVGCATSQLETACNMNRAFSLPIQGLIICLVIAFTSPAAGISTEYIMKKTTLKTDPLHTQNMHLYFFGAIFNMLGYLLYEREPDSEFFEGWNNVTAVVVACYAFSGLTVSIIMRYADNMVKIYAVAFSMVLTMALSIGLFDFKPTLQLLFGIIVITVSSLMYFDALSTAKGSPAVAAPTAPERDETPAAIVRPSRPDEEAPQEPLRDVEKDSDV